MTDLILKALYETIGMVVTSAGISLMLGIPLAIWLNLTGPKGLLQSKGLYQTSGLIVNALRSIPYIILTVLILPLTKLLVGTSIGMWAAVVPLSIAGLLLVARVAEDALRQVPNGLIEVGLSAGATHRQIIRSIILPEALPALIAGCTTIIINLIGFSAMAGAVGGGGLGDLAIRYGYQRNDMGIVLIIVAILIVIVQAVQMVGDRLVSRLLKE
jgi:D-methionine transport system permease protein